MKAIRLMMWEHEDSGFIGLVVKANADWMDPTSGIGIAHDLLEHFPGDRGTMEEEMMAAGAALFVRGDDYFRDRSPYHPYWAENVSADFRSFADYFIQANREGRLHSPGKTKPLDDYLEEAIDNLHLQIKQKFGEDPIPEWIKHKEDINGWIRKGYRKASKRFSEMSRRGGVPWMYFIDLEKKIDKVMKKGLELGDYIDVTLNLSAYKINIKLPPYLE